MSLWASDHVFAPGYTPAPPLRTQIPVDVSRFINQDRRVVQGAVLRIESRVTSLSWIPQEAMSGLMRVPMDLGVSHYDRPPPDHIDDLEALRQDDRFRFANVLSAWIDVEDGAITGAGYLDGGHIGATTLALGAAHITIPAVPFPDRQEDPALRGKTARFVQTAGGRTGAPMPRKINEPPFFTITSPTAWTTLGLDLSVDGTSSFELIDASPFPRHSLYDSEDHLVEESGLIDFKSWTHEYFGDNTPWGHIHEPVVMTHVETSLERRLSEQILGQGHKPRMRKLEEGDVLVTQGEESIEMYLLMDGLLLVEVDGEQVTRVGPGAILGERASLEGGRRTASLRAATPVHVAVVSHDQIDPDALSELATYHGAKPSAEHQVEERSAQPNL